MLRQVIETALTKNTRIDSRWFQFATVDPQGFPSVRTVVFRGFQDQDIVFVTDLRSDKVKDLQRNPVGEICWYFSETREQFRIRVDCSILTGENSRRYWNELSASTRAQFTWPMEPSSQEFPTVLDVDDPKAPQAFLHFCVVLCRPIQTKYLDLCKSPSIPIKL